MKKLSALLVVAGLALTAGISAAQWSDNLDSYADQAEFNSVWVPSGTALNLVQDKSHSSPNALYQGTGAQQSRRPIGADIITNELHFSFWFYDSAGTSSLARSFGMVYARADGAWDGGLQQILAIGKYNDVQTTKYSARIAFGPGSGWFTLDSGPDRSVGWQFAEIAGDGNGNVEFKINGIVGATKPVADVGFNWVVMGSGLSSTHGMWFDDINIDVVPEPTSLLILGTGFIGLAGVIRRRKA